MTKKHIIHDWEHFSRRVQGRQRLNTEPLPSREELQRRETESTAPDGEEPCALADEASSGELARELRAQEPEEGSLQVSAAMLDPNTGEFTVGLGDASTAALDLPRLELERIPVLGVAPSDLHTRKDIDHRAGFLLSLIDGHLSYRELLDLCPMDSCTTLQLLGRLLQIGVLRERDDERCSS